MIDYSIEGKKIRNVHGYEIIFDPKHPLANKSGQVYVHRHVMSIKVGRWLTRKELVHHIDENRSNNDPENLELTTRKDHPREHNLVEKNLHNILIVEMRVCENCGKEYKQRQRARKLKYCSRKCAEEATRKIFLTKEELQKLIWEKPTSQIAKEIGCSDKAIEKKCKRLGIKKPPRGYWEKLRANTL